MADTFPRRYALTGRFTHGAPRSFTVTDAGRVVFLRSDGPEDRAASLWVLDPGGVERRVADPHLLLTGAEVLSAEEASLRERRREAGAGITGYALDAAGAQASFVVSGRLFITDLDSGTTVERTTSGPAIDPRLSPDGRRVAYIADRGLHVTTTSGPDVSVPLAVPEGPEVSWGLADFVAAEEFGRFRGYWWAPDSTSILAARVDNGPVARWWIADPAHPDAAPQEHRYPAAGTDNAIVDLFLLGLDGTVTPVPHDHEALPYLTAVSWTDRGHPLVQRLSRRQETAVTVSVDPEDGTTRTVATQTDPAWVDVVPGVPTWDTAGRLLTVAVDADTYRLCADGTPLTPAGWQVRAVDVAGEEVLVAGGPDAGQRHVLAVATDGSTRPLTTTPGMHALLVGGPTQVTVTADLSSAASRVHIESGDWTGTVSSTAESPPVTPAPTLTYVAGRPIRMAVLYPTGWETGSGRLPVLLDPYGGPHASRAVHAASAHLVSQWFADAGFAVIVADGRGTPGTPASERTVRFDLATPALEDQLAALDAAAADHPDLDLTRVGIRGWSYGGYLAALAVLRAGDRVHAAVAGAPPTDWRLYDTAYTERYLGLPAEHPQAYERTDLTADAAALPRPLLLIHGLADDNVLAAHTLRLSTALLAAGRDHSVLPLTGVTHMTPQVDVAENLLLLQRDFLLNALG